MRRCRRPERAARARPLRLLIPFLALGVLLGGQLMVPAAEAGKKKEREERIEALPARYQEWLESVTFLISEVELEVFLGLEKDYQRDAFIERFWRERDSYPNTARNEFRDRYESLLEEARLEFGDLTDARSRIMLLNGPPSGRLEVDCTALWPAEIWVYDRNARVRDQFFLLFYQPASLGPYRLWQPADGVHTLTRFMGFGSSTGRIYSEIANACLRGEEIVGVLRTMLNRGAMDYAILIAELEEPPSSSQGAEWVSTFASYTTDLPEDAETFEAELSFDFPGRHQSRTVVQGLIAVPLEEVERADLAGVGSLNFVLTGEVLRDGALFESFRYRFNLADSQVPGEGVPLLFERKLRPGDYRVVVKLEDLNSGRIFRTEAPLSVPALEEAPPPTPEDPESARLLAEANAALATGDSTIQLIPPVGDLQTGLMRFDTLTTGDDIAEAVFSLDGRPLFTKKRPPFSVEVDLGDLPRMRTLEVTAYDEAGREVAGDRLLINAGSHRFAVRLKEPRSGETYSRSLRAEAEVEVPEGQPVERVELYLNEDLVATLYQPPFEHPLVLPSTGMVAYVRAVAYQPDGNSTEDLVFINAPEYLEEVDVQFVELYIAAVDRERRPVEGLTVEDFTVLEDGVEQRPMRFDVVENLPIQVGVMADVSASMAPSLEAVKQAALGFFQAIIQPEDRAALITFNDHPQLAVKFTNQITSLAGGLAGLKAERGTALYDSLIFALYYFNGVKGQRALVLLSDGKDESSRFTFDDTLEYARRAGVSIYAIGLDLTKGAKVVKRELSRIAQETGGQSFFVKSAEELPAIYAAIEEELRSRYYLAYQSSNTSDSESFRTIQVEVDRKGVEAKTLQGYYP